MSLVLAVDVGGTFTDFVSFDRETGTLEVWKELSTPEDPVAGILAGIARVPAPERIDALRIGTTVATNAILERRTATVAYLTTRGFRDVPFIQRGNRRSHYDMSWVKPKPLVRRRHCLEVEERLDAHGRTVTPLDEASVRAAAAALRALPGIEAVAVCLLFSYLDPAHERRVRAILAETLPGLPVSISYDVLPRWKEYERASTTIADAALKPVVGARLAGMGARLRAAGVRAPAVVIKSNGGETSLEAAAAAPVQLVLSGPTGGVIAAREVARELGQDRLVTIDMGGTSTDVSLVLDRRECFTTAFEIEWGVPIQVPMIDIRTIGAGGGSIAWVDTGGLLQVGPRSAGASPGPACYGRGGVAATVTDANLLLGRIDPERFLGGRMRLDRAAAETAVARIARELDRPLEATALAITRIVDTNMVGALRSMLIERGLDPRDFTLCAFGGATPLHVTALLREMEIPRAVVPIHPAQFSALGFVLADPRVDRQRTTQLTSRRFDPQRADTIMEELVAEAVGELRAQGHDREVEVRRVLEMRYLGQNYELELELDGLRFADRPPGALWERFHAAHRERFGFAIPGEIVEIVTYAVTAVGHTAKPALPRLPAAAGPARARTRRPVRFLDGVQTTPVFERSGLGAGAELCGPALVEEPASVTVLEPGWRLRVAPGGHLLIDRSA